MEVTVYGLRDTQRALKSVDKRMSQEFDQKIAAIFEPLVSKSRSLIPDVAISGWKSGGAGEWNGRLGWNPDKIRRGIEIKRRTRRGGYGRAVSAAYALINKTPAGAVYELAGIKNPQGNGTEKSRRFISGLTRHSPPPRGIKKAYAESGGDPQAKRKVLEAVVEVQQELQAKLNAAGDRLL
jgi:hypothetical protein